MVVLKILFNTRIVLIFLLILISSVNSKIKLPFTMRKNTKLSDEASNNIILSYDEDTHLFLKYELRNNYMDQMLVTINIGTPPQQFTLLVDSGSNILWISDSKCNPCPLNIHKFNKNQSTSFLQTDESKMIKYATGNVKGKYVKEKVSFGMHDDSIELKILIAEESDGADTDGIIGMGYKTDNETSIIDTLFNQKKIENNMYTQIYDLSNKENIKGEILLGEYPKVIKERFEKDGNKNFLGSCKLSIYNSHWACQLTSVAYGNSEEEREKTKKAVLQDIIFDTGANRNILSPQLYTDMIKTYFKDFIDSEKCKEKQTPNTSKLICKKETLSELKNINFIIGDWVLFMKPDEYLYLEDDELKLNIISMNGVNVNLFGEPMLKLFISIFNKGEEKFEFYGENMFTIKDNLSDKASKEVNIANVSSNNGQPKSFFGLIEIDETTENIVLVLFIVIVFVLGVLVYFTYNLYQKFKKRRSITAIPANADERTVETNILDKENEKAVTFRHSI